MPELRREARDDGPKGALIAIIGEALGAVERAQRKPFVGPSGARLNGWLRTVGLDRRDIRVMNVVQRQPPGNKISAIPKDELALWIEDLHQRLAELDDPIVLVPLGNTALQALTGLRNITKHRGSIYEYADLRGRRVKTIGSLHPAYTFREPSAERRCLADWRRIVSDAEFRELRLPERELWIRPTESDLNEFNRTALEFGSPLAVDIETPNGDLACIGFSFDPSFAICIPLTIGYWHGATFLANAQRTVADLLASPLPKVFQNGLFDVWHLQRNGYEVRNWWRDTLAQCHLLDPTDDHDLAYQASIFTREPYWKDEAKDPEAMARYVSNLDAFYSYNCKDVAVTRELADIHEAELERRGLVRFYEQNYQALFEPILALMEHGIRVDTARQAHRQAQTLARIIEMQARLTALAGEPLYGPKGALSTKRLGRFLYETLRLPKQFKTRKGRDEKTLTADEVTVRRLMRRFPAKLAESGQLILDTKRESKRAEFLNVGRNDDDGRIRCWYTPTTVTLRLASRKSPSGRGANLQNIDRGVRDLFVPDEGCVLLEVDLSQAEDRVVKVLTAKHAATNARREELLWRARAMPWENDEHVRAQEVIKRVTGMDVTRYEAKRGRHGSNYGEGGKRYADELSKEGITVSAEEGDAIIAAILDHDVPEIRAWQRETRLRVLADRVLANTWGFTIDLSHERPGDDLWRAAYAWVPQSEVAMILNRWGLIPLDREIRRQGWRSRINLQMHDSLVISAWPGEAWLVYQFLKASLERARTYGGESLLIPCEVKLGRNWGKSAHEWKRTPSKEELTTVIEELMR